MSRYRLTPISRLAGRVWRVEVYRRRDGLHVLVQGSRQRIAVRVNDGLVRPCVAERLVRCIKEGICFGQRHM